MGEYDKDDVVNFNKTIEQQFKVKGAAKRVPNGDDEAEFYDIFYTDKFDGFVKDVRALRPTAVLLRYRESSELGRLLLS